jgi:hypothetical protein
MIPRSSLAAVLVVGVAVVGLSLKLGRYTASPGAVEAQARERIAVFMATHGWRELPASQPGKDEVYGTLEFEKPGCERLLTVAILGSNTELERYLRLLHGAELAFVQDGRVLGRPSMLARHWERVVEGLTWSGAGGARPLPLLAVSPPPGEAGAACLPPAARLWGQLAAG